MELSELLADMNPEELEPRLELQILADPLNSVSHDAKGGTNNCQSGSTCNVKQL